MTVIEVDAEYVEPYVVDSIQIHAAQRYSFFHNGSQQVDNYWTRAIQNPVEGTSIHQKRTPKLST